MAEDDLLSRLYGKDYQGDADSLHPFFDIPFGRLVQLHREDVNLLRRDRKMVALLVDIDSAQSRRLPDNDTLQDVVTALGEVGGLDTLLLVFNTNGQAVNQQSMRAFVTIVTLLVNNLHRIVELDVLDAPREAVGDLDECLFRHPSIQHIKVLCRERTTYFCNPFPTSLPSLPQLESVLFGGNGNEIHHLVQRIPSFCVPETSKNRDITFEKVNFTEALCKALSHTFKRHPSLTEFVAFSCTDHICLYNALCESHVKHLYLHLKQFKSLSYHGLSKVILKEVPLEQLQLCSGGRGGAKETARLSKLLGVVKDVDSIKWLVLCKYNWDKQAHRKVLQEYLQSTTSLERLDLFSYRPPTLCRVRNAIEPSPEAILDFLDMVGPSIPKIKTSHGVYFNFDNVLILKTWCTQAPSVALWFKPGFPDNHIAAVLDKMERFRVSVYALSFESFSCNTDNVKMLTDFVKKSQNLQSLSINSKLPVSVEALFEICTVVASSQTMQVLKLGKLSVSTDQLRTILANLKQNRQMKSFHFHMSDWTFEQCDEFLTEMLQVAYEADLNFALDVEQVTIEDSGKQQLKHGIYEHIMKTAFPFKFTLAGMRGTTVQSTDTTEARTRRTKRTRCINLNTSNPVHAVILLLSLLLLLLLFWLSDKRTYDVFFLLMVHLYFRMYDDDDH